MQKSLLQERQDQKIQDLKLELEVMKKQHKQEIMKYKIDVEERDNRIEIMLNVMKSNETNPGAVKPERELISESEFRGDVDSAKEELRQAKQKIKRLNRELDEKVARINQLEDNVVGHVEDKRCKIQLFFMCFLLYIYLHYFCYFSFLNTNTFFDREIEYFFIQLSNH